ncbi:MAG: thioredoxin family protein [Chloroflexota bacterium]|nr:thioredoxin family protein [Chloroflexota bacterium]
MEVKILGTGCPRCKRVEQVAHQAAEQAGIEATFSKVTDMEAILNYPITSTPGLVINEKVVCSGRIPAVAEVMSWMTTALSE